jgi:hypothetical protein
MKANKLILQVIILALGLVQTVELRAQAQSYFGDSKPACRCCPPIDQLGVGTQGGLTETWPSRERSNVLAVERTPHEFTIFVGGKSKKVGWVAYERWVLAVESGRLKRDCTELDWILLNTPGWGSGGFRPESYGLRGGRGGVIEGNSNEKSFLEELLNLGPAPKALW